jgi:hypothetical protein
VLFFRSGGGTLTGPASIDDRSLRGVGRHRRIGLCAAEDGLIYDRDRFRNLLDGEVHADVRVPRSFEEGRAVGAYVIGLAARLVNGVYAYVNEDDVLTYVLGHLVRVLHQALPDDLVLRFEVELESPGTHDRADGSVHAGHDDKILRPQDEVTNASNCGARHVDYEHKVS